jgi:7-cyano-7-deazaguanine reductase
MKYGTKEIINFDITSKENYWKNNHKKDYTIDITLPEFICMCPRSGYPDFATIKISYIPNKKVIELKALKLYINSFINKHISHEDSANEIYDLLKKSLKPRWIKLTADFNPRGNVHTIITIDSSKE